MNHQQATEQAKQYAEQWHGLPEDGIYNNAEDMCYAAYQAGSYDTLMHREEAPVLPDPVELAEELWDAYSEHIEDSSWGFEQVAGSSMVNERGFHAAIKELAGKYAQDLSAKDHAIREALMMIDEREAEIDLMRNAGRDLAARVYAFCHMNKSGGLRMLDGRAEEGSIYDMALKMGGGMPRTYPVRLSGYDLFRKEKVRV